MKESCEVLNLDEAGKFLKIGKKTLANLAKKGRIPARKIGREWRFVKSVLVAWLMQGGGAPRPCWEVVGCSDGERDECEVYLNNRHQARMCKKGEKKRETVSVT